MNFFVVAHKCSFYTRQKREVKWNYFTRGFCMLHITTFINHILELVFFLLFLTGIVFLFVILTGIGFFLLF